MGGSNFFHPGLTKYHGMHIIVPLLAAMSPVLYERFLPMKGHHVVKALTYGTITALLTYGLMKTPIFRENRFVLNKAVLLGLLTAELIIFALPDKIPSVTIISFFLFMYFFGMGVDDAHDR